MKWRKEDEDWMRSTHNLPPRPMDWQDKVVFAGSVITSVICAGILAFTR